MKDFIIKARKKRNYEQLTCRIEEDLLEKLKDVVYDNNLESVNKLISDCLAFALNNMKIDK